MNPAHLAFPNRLSSGAHTGSILIAFHCGDWASVAGSLVALGVQLVDFVPQLNQLPKLLKRGHATIKTSGTARCIARSRVGGNMTAVAF